jgi:hypothetical protein
MFCHIRGAPAGLGTCVMQPRPWVRALRDNVAVVLIVLAPRADTVPFSSVVALPALPLSAPTPVAGADAGGDVGSPSTPDSTVESLRYGTGKCACVV